MQVGRVKVDRRLGGRWLGAGDECVCVSEAELTEGPGLEGKRGGSRPWRE